MEPWIAPPSEPVPARYNIAPTQPIAAITNREPRIEFVRWGLIPSWARDESIGNRMINARAESLEGKPAFAKLLKTRRCLIPADGFFEWKVGLDGKSKIPMYIRIKGGAPFAFAGLWDTWRGRGEGGGEITTSCTMITVAPNELVKPIHNRMPAIIGKENFRRWLSGDVEPSALLRPYPSEEMEAFAVSNLVNSPRNEGPSIIEPVVERQGNLFG